MPHVFVSYKREDRTFVDELERRILGANLAVWTDRHIQAGDNWEESIDGAIKNAFAVVLVMTPAARVSEYVTYEWSFAMGLGIPIIPIMLIQTDVHPKLNRIQNLNFTNRYGEPWDALLTRLDKLKTGYKEPSAKALPLDTSIAGFVEDLQSRDAGKVASAAETLAMMNHAEALPYLINALNKPLTEWEDDTKAVQDTILTALGELGDAIALPHIIRFATQGIESAILALAGFPEEEAASKTLIRLYEKAKDNQRMKFPILLAMAKIFAKHESKALLQVFIEELSIDSLYAEYIEIQNQIESILEAENDQQGIEEFITYNGINKAGSIAHKLRDIDAIFEKFLFTNDFWLKIVSPTAKGLVADIQSKTRYFRLGAEIAQHIRQEIERLNNKAT